LIIKLKYYAQQNSLYEQVLQYLTLFGFGGFSFIKISVIFLINSSNSSFFSAVKATFTTFFSVGTLISPLLLFYYFYM